MAIKKLSQPRSLEEQSTWELRKLARIVRRVQRQGDQVICQRLLSHVQMVQGFIEKQKYAQALHVARCRMMG